MAAAPRFKIYRDGEYVASCKYADEASVLVTALYGSEVRASHLKRDTLFTHAEAVIADGYDSVAEAILHADRRRLGRTQE